jgi:DNA-binding XRE family transcriptional regulator
MREIRTSGLTSGEGKRGVAERPKLPRPSSTLQLKTPLAFFRKKRGISQGDLAKRAGITQGYLSEIEIGRKSGDVRTLRKLADALAVPLDSLVPDEPSEDEAPRPRAKKRKAS